MKQKILSLSLILLLIFSLGACAKNAETTQSQSVTIKVVAESKDFSKDVPVQTSKTTLGEVLDELGIATYNTGTYGKYITGLYDIIADEANQEWWYVTVNGVMAEAGVDGITVKDGDVYTFELKIGY